MKLLSFIITLPIAIVAIIFAVMNRDNVTIDLLGIGYEVTAPTFVIVLLPFVLGFIFGGVMSWITHGRYRKETRLHRRENKKLQAEVDRLSKELEKERKTINVRSSDVPTLKIIDNNNF